jgi:uncharacterized DUF497 family protein
MEIFSQLKGFEWDEGNISKNWEKHKVTHLECEEIFFNEPLIVKQDKTHSISEERYFALGKTDRGRVLFVVFTARGDKIRVISARDASKKERRYYK